ncbi:MAG: DUF493 family protein [Bacteroidota bacterium]
MFDDLKNTLDAQNALPGIYMFKFIAPKDKQEAVASLFHHRDLTLRDSKNGNYVSVTAQVYMETSQDVINVLITVAAIPGVISL